MVAYWCRLNAVTLEINYCDEVYTCRLTQGKPAIQVIETTGSANLCCELLIGASLLAKNMRVVNPPYPSMRWRDFVAGRKDGKAESSETSSIQRRQFVAP